MVLVEIGLFIVFMVFVYVIYKAYEMAYAESMRSVPYEEIRAAYRFYKFKSEVEERGFDYKDMMAEYHKFFRKNRRGSIKDIDAEIEGELDGEELGKAVEKTKKGGL